VSETADRRRLTELRSLLRVIEDAGWEYARVEIDGVTLVVSTDPAFAAGDAPAVTPMTATATAVTEPATQPVRPVAPEEAPGTPATETAPPENHPHGPVATVTSPTIGLFWRSPKPSAPPFVEVGGFVRAGDTVCIIEVMKLMTHVPSPVTGTVIAIHIENGSMVEHGTTLIDVAPSDDEEGSR
jgi:acetyl-CoA carboxylase biotin carboxyl carrier protein